MSTQAESILQLTPYFRFGSFARVEINKKEQRALKIFYAKDLSNVDLYDRPFENDIRRIVFNEEIYAYKKASENQETAKYVPKFYGTHQYTKVISEHGIDVSKEYLLDCCYEMEFVNGTFYKLYELENLGISSDVIERIKTIFSQAGILLKDASATVSDDRCQIEKLVDIATRDVYHEETVARF